MKKDSDFEKKIEKYLEGVPEAINLFEVVDLPPSRVRAILIRVINDYFEKIINEKILIKVGTLLHHLQFGTWDYDPDIMSITCSLVDYNLGESPLKYEREQQYRKWLSDLSDNQTISVSLPAKAVKELEIMAENKLAFRDLIKEAVFDYLNRPKS